MAKPIVEVKNLVKRYKKSSSNAVDDISFQVGQGELFALLGPNGAGKTTTISILTTILSKTSGVVTIAGFDLDKDSSLVRQNVGIIFQNPSLDQNLTAEENIRFHAVLYGLYSFYPTFSLMPADYQKRVHELAGIIGLKNELFKPVKTFSGGMKRKLEIIRSLMHKPKMLFLDEPSSGLDPLSRKNLWEYLTSVRKSEKMTIFLTTHYLEEAEDADNVCIINKGKIVIEGTPQTIKDHLLSQSLILDAKNKNELKNELTKLKLDFKSDALFEVDLKGKNIQKVIQSIKTPLSVLRINQPSLEDAYLQIVEEKNEKL